jgi:hypothetical protein
MSTSLLPDALWNLIQPMMICDRNGIPPVIWLARYGVMIPEGHDRALLPSPHANP